MSKRNVLSRIFRDECGFYRWNIWGWGWTFIGVITVWGLGWGGYNIALNVSRTSCQSYGEKSSRETEYVNLSWGEWGCFVNVDGIWVLKEQVWANGVQP